MSLTLGTSFSDVPTTKKEMGRSSANFHPNVWGDRFGIMPSKEMEIDASTKQRAEMLKQDVKKMLGHVSDSDLQEMNLINEIQRLGVAYHFEYLLRWWNESDLPKKLPFVRDRLVECYIWMLELYYEPQYSQSRRMTTILLILTSIMDDIYDVYGKLDELELYTVAVERETLDQLPDYMKVHLGVLLTVVENFEEELGKEGKSYHLGYVKKAFAELAKAYIKEARWAHAAHVPRLEEYMNNAVVSCGYPLIIVMSFLGMGQVATKEALEWAMNLPNAVRQGSIVGRLANDIMSNQSEQERVHVASAVQCCIKEYNTTYEEACKILQGKISAAWKDLSMECLNPNPVPREVMKRPLNLARATEFYYQCRDGYTDSAFEIKDYITMLLVEPVAVV
ncbi:hypothetical protein ACLOJK_039523 [Asimina triloba]